MKRTHQIGPLVGLINWNFSIYIFSVVATKLTSSIESQNLHKNTQKQPTKPTTQGTVPFHPRKVEPKTTTKDAEVKKTIQSDTNEWKPTSTQITAVNLDGMFLC